MEEASAPSLEGDQQPASASLDEEKVKVEEMETEDAGSSKEPVENIKEEKVSSATPVAQKKTSVDETYSPEAAAAGGGESTLGPTQNQGTEIPPPRLPKETEEEGKTLSPKEAASASPAVEPPKTVAVDSTGPNGGGPNSSSLPAGVSSPSATPSSPKVFKTPKVPLQQLAGKTEHTVEADGMSLRYRIGEDGKRVWLCNFCTKTFYNNRCNLVNHTRSHTGEKPFQCLKCSKRFTTKGNMKKHMEKCGNDRKKPGYVRGPYKKRNRPKGLTKR